jgi:hypothetical protein
MVVADHSDALGVMSGVLNSPLTKSLSADSLHL